MTKKLKRELKVAFKSLFMIIVIMVIVTLSIRMKFEKEYVPYPESLSTLPLNDYDKELFIENDQGIMHYQDDNYIEEMGIDVSEHQRVIDWKAVKDSGVDFAYLRAGYRGYSEGGLHQDYYFLDNYNGAKENGIKVGVYFFSQAINEKEAREEAEYLIDIIKDLDIDLEIVYDYEMPSESRIKDLPKPQYSLNALSFCTTVETYGYKPMIYTNLDWIYNYYDMSKILNYDIWYAQYYKQPETIYSYSIWQYSEKGIIDGINEEVDLNIRLTPINNE